MHKWLARFLIGHKAPVDASGRPDDGSVTAEKVAELNRFFPGGNIKGI